MIPIMRYPKEHKAAVKERIVRTAARTLRKRGLGGVGIPALMKQAGLTHGGFYGHFKNRGALVAEAVQWAAAQTAQGVFGEERSLEETLAAYLSARHLDHPEEGCVLAALGADAGRQPARVQGAFAQAAMGFLELTQRKLTPRGHEGPVTDAALVQAATMLGAIILGRLVRDPPLSARILSACRANLST